MGVFSFVSRYEAACPNGTLLAQFIDLTTFAFAFIMAMLPAYLRTRWTWERVPKLAWKVETLAFAALLVYWTQLVHLSLIFLDWPDTGSLALSCPVRFHSACPSGGKIIRCYVL
jgi:hypothetical protein